MSRAYGKKIDTWEFTVNHVKVEVVVRMRTASRGAEGMFMVSDDNYSLLEKDSDINALKNGCSFTLRSI